jgi:hypothetical protein
MRFAEASFPILVVSTLLAARAAGAAPARPTPPASAPPAATSAAAPSMAAASLPDWHEPDAYSVDLVMSGDGQTFTMERAVDHGRMRSHIAMDKEHEMVLLELPDEKETTYTLMPSQKMALKQTAEDTASMMAQAGGAAEHAEPAESRARPDAAAAQGAPPADVKIELLGTDEIDGKSARKYRVTSPEGSGLAWFDAQSNAPVRMESEVEGKKGVIEWKNWKVGPQKAELFEVPKDYNVQDVGAMMQMMKGMSGRQFSGLAQGSPGGGMPGGVPGGMPAGLPGGLPGMPGGMGMGGMGQRMGSQFGAQFGSTLGASFGGPLGAMAGHYIGGKVGGFLGKKAAGAVMPGN